MCRGARRPGAVRWRLGDGGGGERRGLGRQGDRLPPPAPALAGGGAEASPLANWIRRLTEVSVEFRDISVTLNHSYADPKTARGAAAARLSSSFSLVEEITIDISRLIVLHLPSVSHMQTSSKLRLTVPASEAVEVSVAPRGSSESFTVLRVVRGGAALAAGCGAAARAPSDQHALVVDVDFSETAWSAMLDVSVTLGSVELTCFPNTTASLLGLASFFGLLDAERASSDGFKSNPAAPGTPAAPPPASLRSLVLSQSMAPEAAAKDLQISCRVVCGTAAVALCRSNIGQRDWVSLELHSADFELLPDGLLQFALEKFRVNSARGMLVAAMPTSIPLSGAPRCAVVHIKPTCFYILRVRAGEIE